jgi:hypothetical protein
MFWSRLNATKGETMRKVSLALAAMALLPSLAAATPITGYSTGTFTCTSGPHCTAAPPNQLKWGGLLLGHSELTADQVSFGAPAGATGVAIAKLVWDQDYLGSENVDAAWNLDFTFTDPADSNYSSPVSISIADFGLLQFRADKIRLGSLPDIELGGGYKLTDLAYVGDHVTGNVWTNEWSDRDQTLYVTANFEGPSYAPPSEVPEPASMMLLGTGLVGLAGAARRRMKK